MLRAADGNTVDKLLDEVAVRIRDERGDTPEATRAIDFVSRAIFNGLRMCDPDTIRYGRDEPYNITLDHVKLASMRQLYELAYAGLLNTPGKVDCNAIVDDNVTVSAMTSRQWIMVPPSMTWAPVGFFRMTDGQLTGGRNSDQHFMNFMKNSLGTMRRENRVEVLTDLISNNRLWNDKQDGLLEWLPDDELADIARRSFDVTELVVVPEEVVRNEVRDTVNGLVGYSKKMLKNVSVCSALAKNDELLEKFVKLSGSEEAFKRRGKKMEIDGGKVSSKVSVLEDFLGMTFEFLIVPEDYDGTESFAYIWNNVSNIPDRESCAIIPFTRDIPGNSRHEYVHVKTDFMRAYAKKAVELGIFRAPTDSDYAAAYASQDIVDFFRLEDE